ncbi:MAG: AAA family ATPase [Acidobacteria bacterium]|jgi:predicted ATPase|nr:AAA family ATPase [Acidobacteriota bacterium]
MIKRIKISNYKSFRDLDINLRPLTVIFGPNGSGKSNFLDAIYLLSRVVTAKNLNEAFKNHRGLPLESFYYADDEGGREGLANKTSLQFSFEVDVEISSPIIEKVERIILEKRKGIDTASKKQIVTEKCLRYRLSMEILPATGHLRVINEKLVAIKNDGTEKKRNAFLETKDNRLQLRIEGQAQPTFHEIGLDHTIVSTALFEPHYPHITTFRAELENWFTYYLEPRQLMREELPLAEIESLGPRGENLAPFLNTLKHNHKEDFENLNLVLKTILPSASGIEINRSKEGLVGLRFNENDRWFSSRLVSEGTLRIIGLLCSIHPRNPATTIAFEEPENGVHPARIEIISTLLKNASKYYGKQIIITTHSPVLAECFDHQDLFVCQKVGGQTSIGALLLQGSVLKKQFSEGEVAEEHDESLADRILRGDFGG